MFGSQSNRIIARRFASNTQSSESKPSTLKLFPIISRNEGRPRRRKSLQIDIYAETKEKVYFIEVKDWSQTFYYSPAESSLHQQKIFRQQIDHQEKIAENFDSVKTIVYLISLPTGELVHDLQKFLNQKEIGELLVAHHDKIHTKTWQAEYNISRIDELIVEKEKKIKQTAVYETHPRICVIAGPGCGKTKTLVSRLIYLLTSQKAQPQNILVLTFAKKAIKEIKKRVFSHITTVSPKDLHIYNFHSFCFNVLNKHSHLLGFPDKYLKTNKALDFNDLLLYTIALFNYHPQVRKEYQNQFTHILLDEFQDINTIYGFQGATPELISSFTKNKEEKIQFSDIAVLYRNNYLSTRLEQELVAQRIPYEILGSFKFIEREEIKDVLSFLRTIMYQDNISLLRILGLQEKIGARTIEKIEQNSEKEGISIYNYLNNFATITNLSEEKFVSRQVEIINKKLIKTRNNLILSSVHQAKGLEFEVVFFVYLDQGTLPYKETQDLTEEKRLFYVGITRAKRLLYLISSQELYSPFLDEIDKEYLVKNGY
ncbi:1800_t:CDS:2 [Gigaspora margarita]|uniref:DNA 3'-5' helicase n=1 Tax=Gigaspora margarita TaxID=4874 RepID=A0ABM8W1Q0_GIGMA|nr:1800_t:CDS:2 [Gigaspora margarita]